LALVDNLRPTAAALVDAHWAEIERVAAALADGAMLSEAQVDALVPCWGG
jgi:hypothetical protein